MTRKLSTLATLFAAGAFLTVASSPAMAAPRTLDNTKEATDASCGGKDGKEGADKKCGKDGKDGKDKKCGKDGKDKKCGKDGKDKKCGKDGKDGKDKKGEKGCGAGTCGAKK